MSQSASVYIALGSNLGDPPRQIADAVCELAHLALSGSVERSQLFRNAPLGCADQPDFFNAVVRFETRLFPMGLLEALQSIEQRHGRVRREKWGARTLDLDLLLYGGGRIDHPRLRVPHPEIAERAFVLRPMFDLNPAEIVPGMGSVRQLLETCPPWRMEWVTWPL